MKNILASSIVIAALGSLLVGSTAALFTDQEVLAGNTVSTDGSLELTLNHSAGKPFTITDAYPGFLSSWEYIDIFNSGDMPFEALMSFEKTAGDLDLYNALTIELVTAGGDSDCDTDDFGQNVIFDGLLKDYDSSTVVSSDLYWHLASGDPADDIQPTYSERICQRIGVDINAGNEILDKTVTFSEIVNAVQDND
jgi:predicted ribosomally synthesized peptide with SipW-like signal peptide